MKGFKRLLLNLLILPIFGVCAIPGEGVSEEVDFDAFFTEAAGTVAEEGAAPPEPEDDDPAKKAEQEAAAAKEAEDKAATEKAEQEAAAAKEAEDKAAQEKAEQERIDAQAREAVEKAAREKAEAEKQEREKAEAGKPSPEEEARLAEEKAADEQFRKEWPDHARLLDKQASEIADLRKMVQETLAAVSSKVDPLIATTQAELDAKHEAAILAAHSDAYDLVPDIEAWIVAQPDFLQPAYKAVLENGTVEQTIKFLNDFKVATGRTQSAEDKAAAEKAAQEKAAKEKAERDKALHLAPVDSRRTQVTSSTVDADDFDGAFAAASNELVKQRAA